MACRLWSWLLCALGWALNDAMLLFSHSELETKRAEVEMMERMHSELLAQVQGLHEQHACEQRAALAALRDAESRATRLSSERTAPQPQVSSASETGFSV